MLLQSLFVLTLVPNILASPLLRNVRRQTVTISTQGGTPTNSGSAAVPSSTATYLYSCQDPYVLTYSEQVIPFDTLNVVQLNDVVGTWTNASFLGQISSTGQYDQAGATRTLQFPGTNVIQQEELTNFIRNFSSGGITQDWVSTNGPFVFPDVSISNYTSELQTYINDSTGITTLKWYTNFCSNNQAAGQTLIDNYLLSGANNISTDLGVPVSSSVSSALASATSALSSAVSSAVLSSALPSTSGLASESASLSSSALLPVPTSGLASGSSMFSMASSVLQSASSSQLSGVQSASSQISAVQSAISSVAASASGIVSSALQSGSASESVGSVTILPIPVGRNSQASGASTAADSALSSASSVISSQSSVITSAFSVISSLQSAGASGVSENSGVIPPPFTSASSLLASSVASSSESLLPSASSQASAALSGASSAVASAASSVFSEVSSVVQSMSSEVSSVQSGASSMISSVLSSASAAEGSSVIGGVPIPVGTGGTSASASTQPTSSGSEGLISSASSALSSASSALASLTSPSSAGSASSASATPIPVSNSASGVSSGASSGGNSVVNSGSMASGSMSMSFESGTSMSGSMSAPISGQSSIAASASGVPSASFSSSASQPTGGTLQITPPQSLTQCQSAQISFSGGQVPYFLSIYQSGALAGNPLQEFPQQSVAGTYTWNVNLPAGTEVIFRVLDGANNVNYSGPVEVQQGSTDCLS